MDRFFQKSDTLLGGTSMKYLFRSTEATLRRIDDALRIKDIFDGKEFSFDLVKAQLQGNHPTVINRISDRIYYVLSGNGWAAVNGFRMDIGPGDLVKVPKGSPHTINGSLEYLIVTSPPFSPANEEIVDNAIQN
jgi:mannose-6-phosphate isomerase-like protein (cupin superfamily)